MRRIKLPLLLIFSFFLSFPVFAETTQASDNAVYLGTAKVDITPPVGTPLAGYGKRHGKPSTAVHDPLYARALSLTREDKTYTFVSADLLLVDSNLQQAVIKKIKPVRAKWEENSLILFATHSHSGAGAIGGRFWERFIMGKFRKNVFQKITDGIARAVIESMNSKIPVTAEYGQTRIDELVENRMDQKLDNPDWLKILRFKNAEGKIAGMLVEMAAHPTILPAKNMSLSADFPGVITHWFEEQFPGSVTLFANGAAGDLRTHTAEIENRFERMKAYGGAVVQKTQNISFEGISLDGPWQSFLKKEKLPRVKIRAGWIKLPSLIGNRVFPRSSYFQAVRLGPMIFLTFPGEISSGIGYEIEKRTRHAGLNPMIIGYAHDYIGYIIPRRYYHDRRQYESRASFYGKKADWFFQRQADRMVNGILTPEEKKDFNPPGNLFYEKGLPVLKLRGTAYHTGFEEGRLLKNEIRAGYKQIFRYLRGQLPIPGINRLVVNHVLDKAWKQMGPYISYEEYEQMRGLAEGSGISMKQIRRLHALPEVYPTWCSNGAYWGKATADGRLIAIRNLDWNRQIGIHRRAAVKFYENPHGISYANIGYYGFTGVLSGINDQGISVGQIGATSLDETMKGVPMPFLLKRVLENSQSLDDAVRIFKGSSLTRGYNYVIADAVHKEAIAIETTARHLAIFGDQDPKEQNVPYAFPVENAVFRGDPALDPAIRDLQWASKGNPKKSGLEMPAGSAYEVRYLKHGQLVKENSGKMDVEIAKQIARQIAPGSNIQSVIYAYPDFWAANAKDNLKAAESVYIHFNIEDLKRRGPNVS